MDDATPEVRIGDRERGEVDARLQKAYADGILTITEYEERSGQCWAARTRGELAVLTRDLPEPEAAAQPAASMEKAQPAPAPVSQNRGRKLIGRVVTVGVVGVAALLGISVLTADDAVALFGGRTVTVAPDDDRVEVGSMFGGVNVIVPADAKVRVEGGMIFGGTSCEDACDGIGTRDVVVSVSGAFGGVSIRNTNEADDDDREIRDERDRDDDEDEDD